ncbi:hypothetical protein BC936DRAFT_143790 [Jimgerdemannia flammicorona]|uniref:Uncharacterized protein n=1 Tax=Jimgerdemannia flammicorona TaxID=994334 RepID=A0A433DME0_9FUNG|nr:hypothetical protein BC936DRAFT_143790 [Jimgerdemannia flammicorona]
MTCLKKKEEEEIKDSEEDNDGDELVYNNMIQELY